jgi:hypothetical protein
MDAPHHVQVVHLEYSAKKRRKYKVLVGRTMPLKARFE